MMPSFRTVCSTSQWSLTFEVRKRLAGINVLGPWVAVAMEPDL